MEKIEISFEQRKKIMTRAILTAWQEMGKDYSDKLEEPDFVIAVVGKYGVDDKGQEGIYTGQSVSGEMSLDDLDMTLQGVMENAIKQVLKQEGIHIVPIG